MSDQNVARVRASMTAFSRGDLDEALANFAPDVVWEVGPEMQPDADTYRGHEGVREFWNLWRDTFEGFELVIEECRAVGEDHVLARTRGRGRGAGSGALVDSRPFVQLMEFRDGRVVRVRMHASERAALRAAGLAG